MSYLLISITSLLTVYSFFIFLVMKREITWKFKTLIYGTLTFIMLISIFLTFGYYDIHWKKADAVTYTHSGMEGRNEE